MSKSNNKVEFELTNFDPNDIVEFSKWEQRQLELVKEHPFVEIVDRDTYETAKTNRTALVTGRTDLQKERDAVKKELNGIKKFVVDKYDEFIDISKPAEDKQQSEVKRHEAILQAERDREALIEQQRADDLRGLITECESTLESIITETTFENSHDQQQRFDATIDSEHYGSDVLMEFDFLFKEMIARQQDKLDAKMESVIEAEQIRLDQLSVKQQSLINELYIKADDIIDGHQGSEPQLIEQIAEIFRIDFDFGEHQEKFESTRDKMIAKAESKLKDNERDEFERQEKQHQSKVTAQANRIDQIGEGLLDQVFQLNTESTDQEIDAIRGQYKFRPETLLDESIPAWNKMTKRVIMSLTDKLEMITMKRDQIQRNNDARVKLLIHEGFEPTDNGEQLEFVTGLTIDVSDVHGWDDEKFNDVIKDIQLTKAENKIHNERWNSRKPELENRGMVYDEIQEKFDHDQFHFITIALETVLTNGDESWKLVWNDLLNTIDDAKANDQAEQKRQAELKDDKTKMIDVINKVIRIKNPEYFKNEIKNPEMDNLFQSMITDLNAWCDSKIDQIEKY